MFNSSRPKIIIKENLFRVALDACACGWRRIKKNIPRRVCRRSIIHFFSVCVWNLACRIIHMKAWRRGKRELTKSSSLSWDWSCPRNFCIYVTPAWALGRQGAVLLSLGQACFLFRFRDISCLITQNLNRVLWTLYCEGWLNILLGLFACLWSVVFCSAGSFVFSCFLRTEKSCSSSAISELS